MYYVCKKQINEILKKAKSPITRMGYSPKWQPWPVICYYFKKMVILSNKIIMDYGFHWLL